MQGKTIVHISGYALSENPSLGTLYDHDGNPAVGRYGDWERVCWGAQGKPGRIPTGIEYAWSMRAGRVIWSTGATHFEGGLSEAEYMQHLALERYAAMRTGFSDVDFPDEFNFRYWLNDVSVIESQSATTSTSMLCAVPLIDNYLGEEPGVFAVVSSDNHVERVMRDAIAVMRYGALLDDAGNVVREVARPKSRRLTIVGVAAFTSYSDKDARSTLVFDRGYNGNGTKVFVD